VLVYPLVSPGDPASGPVALAVGALLVLVATALAVVARPGRPTAHGIRAAAFGVVAFPVMLGPVLLLDSHLYGYYVAIAAFGIALGTIGGLSALPRAGSWAPVACLAAALAVHAGYARHAIEGERELTFYRGFTRTAVRWLYTVETIDREHPELQQLVARRNFTTSLIFETGAHRLFLPGIRLPIHLVGTPSLLASEPATMIVDAPYAPPPGWPMPGARPEWDWLRAPPGLS
jgi:hypothetical protein